MSNEKSMAICNRKESQELQTEVKRVIMSHAAWCCQWNVALPAADHPAIPKACGWETSIDTKRSIKESFKCWPSFMRACGWFFSCQKWDTKNSTNLYSRYVQGQYPISSRHINRSASRCFFGVFHVILHTLSQWWMILISQCLKPLEVDVGLPVATSSFSKCLGLANPDCSEWMCRLEKLKQKPTMNNL